MVTPRNPGGRSSGIDNCRARIRPARPSPVRARAITFSAPLETAAANDAGSFSVAQWNYRYAAQYGSKDWSVANPDKQGHDEVEIKSARLLPDGRTVFLETPLLRPVMQMEVKYSLNSIEGNPFRNQFWLTLNRLDDIR